ncbi:MAG: glycosyltransferase family 4 protein [Methylococcaceae bacterium]
MRILTFTTLYPNQVQTTHGLFVERRLRYLLELEGIEAIVVAPVPWFPFKSAKLGRYADYSRVLKKENRHGVTIYHPRYPLIPKVGMTVAPVLLAFAVLPFIKKMMVNGGDFDLIDAHYFYPDGVAAAIIGKVLNKPVVITARGTDINLIPQYLLPRKMITWAARQSRGVITVCEALKIELINLGADGKKIHALRNGVNLNEFYPMDRENMQFKYQITRPTLLSVGHLLERKGHHLVIQAMKDLPDYELLIAGDGEERKRLQKLAVTEQVSDRVRFLGALTPDRLAEVYNAVDILVLASSREGWANVLLESMACGTPVIATNIWGTPEVVTTPDAGLLMSERSATAIVKATKQLLENYPSREKTHHYAENFSWDETVNSISNLFRDILLYERVDKR